MSTLSRYENRDICQSGLLAGTEDATVTIDGVVVDYQMNPPLFRQWFFRDGDTHTTGQQYTINVKFVKAVMVCNTYRFTTALLDLV